MASQAPGIDSRPLLASGSRVIIVVSAGQYPTAPRSFAEVPMVVGANQGKALGELQEVGLAAQVFNDYSATVKKGDVIGQLPAAGASVPSGNEAVLLVSSGPPPTQGRLEVLPDLVGKPESEAVSVLQTSGFSPQVVREHSTSVPTGIVVAQLPSRASLAMQPTKSTSWLVWAAVAGVLVLLALAALFFFRPTETVVVPDVVGLPEAEAVAAIEEAGLEAKVTQAEEAEAPDDAEPGTVVEQDPPAGSEVPEGSEEEIIVAPDQELVEVPDVVGEDQANATRILREAGFEVAVSRKDSLTVDKGLVLEQTPAAGRTADPGSTVSIIISNGEPQTNVTVPDVEGLSRADAQEALTDLGLKVVIAENASEDVAEGVVISQLPAAGDSVAPGTSVGIVVSTGPPTSSEEVETPNVVGVTLAEAEQVMSDAGLETVTVPSTGSGKPANEIVAQTPEAGTQVQPGSTVVLYYSSGS